jgi:hypothetical protein
MKDHQNRFPVQAMAEVLQVSASGFYAWRTRPPCDRSVRDRQLVPAVREIHAGYDATCGSRRTGDELTAQGMPCGRHRFTQI